MNYLEQFEDEARDADGGGKHIVTVNKMRGMFSAQVKKWGNYQLRNIDYVMLRSIAPASSASSGSGSDNNSGATGGAKSKSWKMTRLCNRDRFVRDCSYSRKDVLECLDEDSSMVDILKVNRSGGFLRGILPSGANPSDHEPVCVEFELA